MNTLTPFSPETWLRGYIPGASQLDSSTLQPVLFFTLLWNLFETITCARDASLPKIDKHVTDAFTANRLNVADFNRIKKFFQDRYASLDEEGLRGTLLSSTSGPNAHASDIANLHRVLSGEETSGDLLVKSLLFIAYRIRNNLFHGEKKVGNLRSQIDLFNNVNELIARYLSQTHPDYEG